MIEITPKAIAKMKEILASQNPLPIAVRIGVRGGGCSGFAYTLGFAAEINDNDEANILDDLTVVIDQMSMMYIDGTTIDYIETLEVSGFKFINPNITSTCGCGQSFNV
jgi:iron-sulfur cluster assembly accessory protein